MSSDINSLRLERRRDIKSNMNYNDQIFKYLLLAFVEYDRKIFMVAVSNPYLATCKDIQSARYLTVFLICLL